MTAKRQRKNKDYLKLSPAECRLLYDNLKNEFIRHDKYHELKDIFQRLFFTGYYDEFGQPGKKKD